MRQADINRVKKAHEHLKAAVTILNHIKWENCNEMEDLLIKKTKDEIEDADSYIYDIISIQGNEKD